MTLRVLHLSGSAVSDFMAELSLLYARGCLLATSDPARYDVQLAHVSPDGSWRFPDDLSDDGLRAAAPFTLVQALAHLEEHRPDVVVPQMFCRPGMITYRALLDLMHLPFVGNTGEVMALGADKAHARSLVAAAGVAVPTGQVVRRGQRPTLALPVVIKPVDADNSLGLALVREQHQYELALLAAFAHSDRVLVESYVPLGREVRCGVLERGGELLCLPLEEYALDPFTKPIREHADKLAADATGALKLVAKDSSRAWILDPDDPVTQRVQEAARRCHVALGCRHYSLFDFRIDPSGQPWFLEAGLYCSFSPQSVIVMMAEAAGTPMRELFETMIGEALSPALLR